VTRLALAIVVAAGCGSASPSPPVTNHGVPVPSDAESADLAFQKLARDVAEQTREEILGWGTAPLAEDGLPRRFAILQPSGDENREADGAAYLIEESPGNIFAVRWIYSDSGTIWGLVFSDKPRDMPWQTVDEHWVNHYTNTVEGHSELTRFALRNGDLVVLAHQIKGSEPSRYAHDGICDTTCPPLRDFSPFLTVIGPAANADALSR
jgi:hypothetical protein